MLAASPWYDLVLLAAAVAGMPVMSVFAGRQLDRRAPGSLVPRYLFTIARGVLAAGAVLAVWVFAHRSFAALGLDIPINPRGQLGFIAVGLAVLFAVVQSVQIAKLAPDKFDKAEATIRQIKIMPRSKAEFAMFVAVAVNAGIWEELLYRGFLLWYLAPFGGMAVAVAISAVVFGLGHAYQGAGGIVKTGLVGLLFGIGFALTRSLWWLMALHAVIDIAGGMVAFRLARMAARSPRQQAVG
ncbi:MAG: CPBP family intramembrane glutamic endopeptidase [Rhizomicrobium sp.]